MKNLLFLLSVVILLSSPSLLYAFGGCEQDCMKCHTLSKKDAEKILEPLIPNAKVIEVKMARAKGIWEIMVKSGDKSGVAYVDFSLKNVIAGQIVPIETMVKMTQKRAAITKVDVSQIPLENALLLGKKKAKHKVVVFDDPD